MQKMQRINQASSRKHRQFAVMRLLLPHLGLATLLVHRAEEMQRINQITRTTAILSRTRLRAAQASC